MPRPIVHVSDPLARRHRASICIASRMLGVKWLGLVGDPTLFRGREIKVRKFYRAFELAGAVASEKDQRHMGFDDIDPLGLSPVQATGRDEAPLVLALTPTDWARLQDALIVASFWGLNPNRVDRPIERDPQRELAAIFPPSTA